MTQQKLKMLQIISKNREDIIKLNLEIENLKNENLKLSKNLSSLMEFQNKILPILSFLKKI